MSDEVKKASQNSIWKVREVRRENHDVNSLFLEGEDDRLKSRKAGQFATIRIMRPDGWSEPHPFTISCAPEAPYLQFTIKKIGAFTSAIPELSPSTAVMVAGPMGRFCEGIDSMPSIVLIAGGVGITPFLSVLRHFVNINAENHVLLFWSNKTYHDMFCVDEISGMTKKLALKVIHNLSQEEGVSRYTAGAYPNVFFEEGRLNAGILEKYAVTPSMSFFLCGPPPMMEAVLSELASLGVDPEKVEREKFSWK